jgi:hypothetical protein
MTQYARNFTEFVDKSLTAIMNTMNDTETGQKLMNDLLKQSFERNPDLTPEQWSKIKQDFLTFLFFGAVNECPEAMHELGMHVYNELRGENNND